MKEVDEILRDEEKKVSEMLSVRDLERRLTSVEVKLADLRNMLIEKDAYTKKDKLSPMAKRFRRQI